MDRIQNLIDTLQQRLRGLIVPFVRVAVGLMWLENASWKVPTQFTGSFRRYTESAVNHEVFGPYAFFVKNIALKNFSAFGWLTLLTESLIGALLIFGIFTRFASLLGAVSSLAIAFSILHVEHEWPWSYYLMIVVHLALFALDAGRVGGIDSVMKRASRASNYWKRPTIVLGSIAAALGAVGFFRARSKSFGANFGEYLLPKRRSPGGYELSLQVLNQRGAIILCLLGLVLIGAAASNQRALIFASTAGFALIVVSLLVGFRRDAQGQTVGGFVGGNGSTLSLFLGLTIGSLLLAGVTGRLQGQKLLTATHQQ
jgi:thiosulfate dehydrogenase (quinone) large subunit